MKIILKKRILIITLAVAIFSVLLATTLRAADDKEPVVYTPQPVDCSPEAQIARETFYIRNGITSYDPCANTCAVSNGDVVKLSGNDNLEKILKYFSTKGLSPEQAAGITGNLLHESGFSPFRQEDAFKDEWPNGGYGIAKFTGVLRSAVAAKLQEKLPNIYAQYYVPEYGGGTTVETSYVPSGVPENINDQFLITQLDYLYEYMSTFVPEDEKYTNALKDETSLAIPGGMTLYAYIKTLSSPGDVARAWFYLYEQKVDAKDAATVRSASAQSIIDNYPPPSEDGCGGGGGNKQQIAQEIMATGHITYDYGLSDPERALLPDIAAGSNNGNDWPCGMNINILNGIAAIAREHTIRLNSLNRACSNDIPPGSSKNSWHYAGNGSAVDFGPIDGMSSYSSAGANLIMQYMGPFLVDGSGVGQKTDSNGGSCLGDSLKFPAGVAIQYFPDFCNHLHMEVPPDSDPDLKCKDGSKHRCSEANRVPADVGP